MKYNIKIWVAQEDWNSLINHFSILPHDKESFEYVKEKTKDWDKCLTFIKSYHPLNEICNRLHLRQSFGLSGLYEFPNLEELEVVHLAKDHPRISKLVPNLKKLTLHCTQRVDVTGILNLTQLTHLTLKKRKLADLDFLSNLKNLTYLNLNNNKIQDLSAIRHLDKLETLCLDFNEVSDLSPLRGLQSLKKLYLRHNKVESLEPLKSLPNLTYLEVSENSLPYLEIWETNVEVISGKSFQEVDKHVIPKSY